jgi:hypothetical protein
MNYMMGFCHSRAFDEQCLPCVHIKCFGRLDMIRKVPLCFQAGGVSLITTACLLH